MTHTAVRMPVAIEGEVTAQLASAKDAALGSHYAQPVSPTRPSAVGRTISSRHKGLAQALITPIAAKQLANLRARALDFSRTHRAFSAAFKQAPRFAMRGGSVECHSGLGDELDIEQGLWVF